MKITATTITDAQIRTLQSDRAAVGDDGTVETCAVALGAPPIGTVHPRPTAVAIVQRNDARARCAEILNARNAK